MTEYIYPPELWDHQLNTVTKALEGPHPYRAIFHEAGTGKTFTMVTILRNLFRRHRKPLRTLILCPVIVIDNWYREIDRWSNCGRYALKMQGTKKQRIENLSQKGKSIFITNYEALDMEGLFWENKGNPKKPTRVAKDLGFDVIILDESHRARNPSAKRTKILIKMADKIPYRYTLTGTPMLNHPFDVWAQYRILDGGERLGSNFYAFRKELFVDKNEGMGKNHFPNYVYRQGSEDFINRKMYEVADRVLKDECLDLPPLVQKKIFVELSPEQKKAYASMAEHFIAYVNKIETGEIAVSVASIALTKALRLLQIASGFVTTDAGDEITFKKNPRLEGLKDIVEDVGNDKVIIWAVFRNNYTEIAAMLERMGKKYSFLTGAQSQKQKEESVYEFTKKDSQFLIANPGAGGIGVNLIEAPLAVWYNRTFSLEQRLQAIARNYRGGSEMHDKITSIDIVCPGSIDEYVLKKLDGKEEAAESLFALRDYLKTELK